MKTTLSILIIISLSTLTSAQTTAIPDSNFEQALIDLGYDFGVHDGTVITANIDTVSYLQIPSLSISDLTGIEAFTALRFLNCGDNQLTSINMTRNTALTHLYCGTNQLTSIDVTQNIALTHLDFYINQLTSIDVSQNTALLVLDCGSNQLTSLDVTQNPALIRLRCPNNQLTSLYTQNTALNYLWCHFNQLTCLNVSQNTNLLQLFANDNPNLTCIEVANVSVANSLWFGGIDAQTSYSENCNNACSSSAVGIEENSLFNLSLYPNPTTGIITVDLGEVQQDLKITLTNAIGQVILAEKYNSTPLILLDIAAPKGIYFLHLESNGELITQKIIKE
jgi:hypothetical protein